MSTAVESRLNVSRLSPEVMQSPIRAMSVECEQMGGVNLAQGICDTPIPEVVVQGAIDAIHAGRNTYSRVDGATPLRHAIARTLREKNGLDYNPDGEILVTNGATGAFDSAIKALLNPGDEVLLFEPFYGYHLNALRAAGMVPVMAPLVGDDFAMDRDALLAAITPRTRAILINTPSNPAGKVFTREELQWLSGLAIEHDWFVFTDEIYEHFLFDGAQHISPATLPEMRERTLTIGGFSKVFSITGWRIGYLAADKKWTPSIAYFHDLAYICAPTPLQFACAAGLEKLGPEYYSSLKIEYTRKRDMLAGALHAAGLKPCIPRGAYYMLADASAVPGKTSYERALTILHETGVASVPGSAFFMKQGAQAERGETLLRFCFAKTMPDLQRACDALSNRGK
jgi:aminotransferase